MEKRGIYWYIHNTHAESANCAWWMAAAEVIVEKERRASLACTELAFGWLWWWL